MVRASSLELTHLRMQFESDVFENAVRAQLTTTSSKPCTYFATSKASGDKVFVKGPYASMADALVQVGVYNFKDTLAPELPSIPCAVMHLLVDKTYLNCQLGSRVTWKSDSGYFLVCEDLLQPNVPHALPTIKAHSKVWADPVDVVDFGHASVAAVFRHVWYSRTQEGSIYSMEPARAMDYVKHVLLCWVCGCGADLARRNERMWSGGTGLVEREGLVWWNERV